MDETMPYFRTSGWDIGWKPWHFIPKNIQAVLVRLGYSSIITNNRECLPCNGGPALRFQCSVEDRITKCGRALKSYFTRSCHHLCQYSPFYMPPAGATVPYGGRVYPVDNLTK